MKGRLSLLLALVMLITAIPYVSFAQDYDKDLEEAILKSKELFNIGDEYDKFDYSMTTYDDQTIFYLYWGDSKNAIGSVDVTITSDGMVTNYGKWDANADKERTKLPKVSKEEGLRIAEEFIERVSPQFKDNLKYVESNEPLYIHSNSYRYYFVRTENKIPYYNNSINVYVDNFTGEVINYYVNWDMDLKFADTKGVMSIDEANRLYREKLGLDLIYKPKYQGDSIEYYLVYGPLNSNLNLDAKSGEIVTSTSYDYYFGVDETAEAADTAVRQMMNLSPAELEAVESIKGIIKKEEAEKLARDILQLDKDYTANYVRLYKSWNRNDSYYWYLNFEKNTDNEYRSATISINAMTKEVISFNRYEPVPETAKAKYNREESLNIAKKLIEKLAKDKKDLLELNEYQDIIRPLELDNQKYYSFQFIRKYENAYVQNNGIYVSVDAVNGRVTSYNLSWDEVDFPSQDNIITLDKAYDILFGHIGLELKYIRVYGNEKESNDAILAYGLNSSKPSDLDAYTGTILDYNGKPYEESNIITYNDIENSYAKDKINILAQFGIALPGEEFKPKDEIIQRDFLYLLAKAVYPYSEVDDEERLYQLLINMGIIMEEEKAPEAKVTREEAIKYIIKSLYFNKIADIADIFRDIFKDSNDISPELKGYVAIAYGLKIIEGSDGYLYPKRNLKREDAANIIYNYLFNEI